MAAEFSLAYSRAFATFRPEWFTSADNEDGDDVILKKNTASQAIYFGLIDVTNGTALVGATVTAKRSIDGAAQASATGSVGLGGLGQYCFAPSAADVNGNQIGFLFTATGAIPKHVHVTTTAADLADSVRLGLTSLPNAAAEAAGGLYTRGTGAGQLDATSGVIKSNVTQLLGTAWLTPGVAGTPDVNVKLWNALTTVALPLVPTTAGRTLDVSAGGEAGLDWANIGGPTTVVALSGTTISATTNPTAAQVATAVWQDATAGDFTVASSIGKSLYTSGVAPGAANGLFVAGTNAATVVTGSLTTTFTGNLTGSAASVTGAVGSISGVTFPTNFSALAVTAGGIVQADLQTIKTQTVTCAAGVTVLASVGTAATSTAQTGDSFARIGAAGVGLTNLGDSRIANLDAAVSSRMATYTQPTGFLAATFPSLVASTTNITAGVITTATNLTNAPTAGDFTAAMKTSLNNATPAVTVSDKTGFSLATSQTFNNTGTWTGNVVGTVSTLTTYTGNTPQTGDAFARIGATGSGLTSLAPSATALSTAQWTNARAGYLDNVNNANLSSVPLFPSNFAALGINVSGHLSRVTLADTVTTYTGNTPQTGDSFARIGAAGVGLTNLGDSRIANLDAAVSSRLASASYTTPPSVVAIRTEIDSNSVGLAAIFARTDVATSTRMATYSQPTGFLAATFPSLVASPTNITTVTTVDAVTTVNGLAAGAITTASIADGAVTDAKFTVPAVTGIATGLLGMVVQTWRRFFKKTERSVTGGTIRTFANDGTTVLTSQAVTVTADAETVDAAT